MPISKIIHNAKIGDAESQYLLGLAYDEGKQIQRNLLEAVSWYQKAAEQGYSLAQKALGKENSDSNDSVVKHRVTKIYGPPGTGKTTNLIELIREAISSGIEPDMIGYFSFTNKATEEAKSRMGKEFPQYDIEADFPYFQTIHSLANNALRTKVTVISDKQAKDFDPDVQIERPFMKKGDETSQVVRIKHPVLDAATTARSLKIPLNAYLEKLPPTQRWPINKWLGLPYRMSNHPVSENGIKACIAYNEKYEDYKKTLDVIDFADMLDMAVINKMALPNLKLLLIDEAQDLSPAQWDIANILISHAEKTIIAGDDDQAICESFGASAKHFLNTQGNEIVLGKSRRIPVEVHRHLSSLIPKLQSKNLSRKEKSWQPNDYPMFGDGEVFYFGSQTNFVDYLATEIKKEPIKDLLLMFVTNSSLRNFSRKLAEKRISHYAANELIGTGSPDVQLLTIWGAKGGEAHTTALITDSEMDERMLSEDPRLEYVAHSRAKHSFFYVGRYVGEGVKQHSADTGKQLHTSSEDIAF
jgi:superfamily I DNA/RNA helicase